MHHITVGGGEAPKASDATFLEYKYRCRSKYEKLARGRPELESEFAPAQHSGSASLRAVERESCDVDIVRAHGDYDLERWCGVWREARSGVRALLRRVRFTYGTAREGRRLIPKLASS
ncbi:hypothetical protein EXIGLDRAFT_78131 [Exidia glandulosa HHB12029]|uniref:Uncharacterized protein n=1 Tax=Exidia glandulosa HHB12029 TaxID=1314781 RepID=A0A165NYZ8_EXIGL|nr:hypothetical protein EXIGLDRAFT_78131 [Exidia glandulosa HHB12029]